MIINILNKGVKMKLTNKKLIITSAATTALQVFNEVADALAAEGLITNKKEVIDGFKDREAQGSTALAEGFAIPHTVNSEITEPKVVVLKKVKAPKWKTLDGSVVDTAIAIIVPKDGRGDHLTILSALSGKLANAEFAGEIKKGSKTDVEELINTVAVKTDSKKSTKGGFDIVGVTACPTGIAHTYMAAEYIEKAAGELGYTAKVETQGQTVQNTLTDAEIANAKAIILGVDREIDMSRFSGKEVYKTGTKVVIKDAKKVIDDALKGTGTEVIKSSIKSTGGESRVAGEGEMTLENFGSRAWKAVMNGVSFMLPFVIFGGIFIALAFLIDTMAGNADASENFGHENVVAGWVKDIGGVSMGLMIPMLAGYTMYGLIGRPGLLPGFVVGMLAAGSGPLFTTVFGISIPTWLPEAFQGDAGVTSVSSGFIGGIAGAFLATVIIVYVWKLLSKLPQSMRGINQILLLPLVGTGIVAIVFWFVNIPLIYVTWGLLTVLWQFDLWGLTPVLAMLLAMMMAVDMGGPINKTAYTFGITTFTIAGPFPIYMAAVMAGGMVPPLTIAIATLFGREKLWDSADKEGGITNWIMGLSFVTEGAIPFASKYPKSVMPSIIMGSAITGLLVGLFGVGVTAPHGGIFVIALVDGVKSILGFTLPAWLAMISYILFIFAGAIASATLLVFLRKREVFQSANA